MIDRLSLHADQRTLLGKKVKKLRQDGQLPGHVFGKGLQTAAVTVATHDFLNIFHQAGETSVVDLNIGKEKVRPVLIREVQYDPITGAPIHIDFYQVDLSQKVKVPVPLVLIGEQPESVHLGETIVLQTINEVGVEALPADLVEKIEVDIASLKNIDDAITIGQLQFDRNKLAIHAPDEEIVVKLAPAVTAEMEKLLQEQAAETAAAVAEEGAAAAEGQAPAEGEVVEGEVAEQGKEGEIPTKVEGETGEETSTRAEKAEKKVE